MSRNNDSKLRRHIYVVSLKKEISDKLDSYVNDEPYYFRTRSQAAHYFLILGMKEDGVFNNSENRGVGV